MKLRNVWLTVLLLLASLPVAARRYIMVASPDVAPSLAAEYGLVIVKQIPNQNVFLVTAPDGVDPTQLISQVSSDPNVLDFDADGIATTPEAPLGVNLDQSTAAILDGISNLTVASYFGAQVAGNYVTQPATSLIRLAQAQNKFNASGSGIVAIIDTGVDPNHLALQGSLVPGFDFTRDVAGIPDEFLDLDQSTAAILDQSTAAILDMTTVAVLDQSTAAILDQSTAASLSPSALPSAFGHGTMVAGIVHLVAPTAHIMPLKAFHANGTASIYDVVRAIYYAVDVGGADVINMSFDIGQTQSKILTLAVNHANSRGVVCVSSAGNSGLDILVWPAASGNVFGIASTNDSDQQSLFTNYGPVAAMAAPGEGIITTYPGNYYAAAWGTSFSAPFVSGTAALLEQLNPKLNYSSAADALSHAQRISSNLGFGRLDVYGALSAATQ